MSELLGKTSAGNDGFIGFFYDDHEILPQNIQGRFYFDANDKKLDDLEPACKARAVLEGQLLAKRLYLQRANVDLTNNVDRIVITGENIFNKIIKNKFVNFCQVVHLLMLIWYKY